MYNPEINFEDYTRFEVRFSVSSGYPQGTLTTYTREITRTLTSSGVVTATTISPSLST
jgi:hypothetical protein